MKKRRNKKEDKKKQSLMNKIPNKRKIMKRENSSIHPLSESTKRYPCHMNDYPISETEFLKRKNTTKKMI